MPDYNKLIIELELALRAQEKINADYRGRIESLETALSLEKTLSEQRNRTIGELGDELELLKRAGCIVRTSKTDGHKFVEISSEGGLEQS